MAKFLIAVNLLSLSLVGCSNTTRKQDDHYQITAEDCKKLVIDITEDSTEGKKKVDGPKVL